MYFLLYQSGNLWYWVLKGEDDGAIAQGADAYSNRADADRAIDAVRMTNSRTLVRET